MRNKTVKDLMVPIDEYAVVPQNASLLQAVHALEESQAKLPPEKQRHRAVLIVDDKKNVIGKLGHLGFLKALEPKYNQLGDLQIVSRSGLSEEYLKSMMRSMSFWGENLPNLCRRARTVKVKSVMHPITENIDERAPLTEAIHKIVMFQTLSLLVMRKKKVVGILRLSDLYAEVASYIATCDP